MRRLAISGGLRETEFVVEVFACAYLINCDIRERRFIDLTIGVLCAAVAI